MQKSLTSVNSRNSWSPDILKKTDTWFGDNTNKYVSIFRAYGDVDHGENPDQLVTQPLEVWATDIDTIAQFLKGYISRNNLSAGNISSVEVKRNDKPVAKIFYNGRIEYVGD